MQPVSDLTELNIELSEGDPTLSSKERWSFLDNPMRFSARDIPEQAPECIGRFVEWIGTSMIHLQKIVLKNIKFLQTLPANLGNLANLRHLDLSGCTNLNELPNSFSQLLRLQFLSLQDCMYLSIPEDILGQISTLEHVDFQGCSNLADLPEGIPQQESLRYLNVLSTPLMQLPNNLGLLENLEQLRIGSPELTELPSSLSNLSSLTELILMSCYQVKHVPWEDVVWPNIKVLGIYTMEVRNLPFTGWMGYLTDLTVKETWIYEICIPEMVCPRLKNVDLSDNCMLTTIDNLPSTIENLQLQNCSKLQRLTNLSNLAQLKFLDISKCSELQTLNVEGMESLKEIKAVECWKLQRVNGLYQRRKRLNCLQISTENGVLWNAIWKFLTSHSEISTVILSTRAADDTNDEEKAMRSIVSNFENIEALDKFPAETKGGGFYKILENVHSYGAVFMCFITDGPGSSFGVTFVTEKTIGRRYVTMRNGGRCLHVFFWTEDSGRLRDYDIVVSWEPDSSESVGKQWIVMLRDKTEVFELCNRVLSALAPEGFHLHTSE